MSPIFVRPVREQLEHDRLIRHLQHEVQAKVRSRRQRRRRAGGAGQDRRAHALSGPGADRRARSSPGVVEVETGESVNNLEAMAQWVHFARARVPFHLYVPVPRVRRGAPAVRGESGAGVREIWTYRPGSGRVRSRADVRRPFRGTPSGPMATLGTIAPKPAPPPVVAPRRHRSRPPPAPCRHRQGRASRPPRRQVKTPPRRRKRKEAGAGEARSR